MQIETSIRVYSAALSHPIFSDLPAQQFVASCPKTWRVNDIVKTPGSQFRVLADIATAGPGIIEHGYALLCLFDVLPHHLGTIMAAVRGYFRWISSQMYGGRSHGYCAKDSSYRLIRKYSDLLTMSAALLYPSLIRRRSKLVALVLLLKVTATICTFDTKSRASSGKRCKSSS